MIKRANTSKMDWLKSKVNPGKSASSPSNSDLKYQRAHRFDQCNYVFNDGSVQRQFTSYINDIKKLVFNGYPDNREMNSSQSCIRAVCDAMRSMSSLISSQSSISELASDLSNIMCTEKFVRILLSWTKFCHQKDEHVDRLMSEQFILYDLFLAQSNQQFLTESEHLQPLLELLNLCSLKLQNDLSDNPQLEEKFLFTLHQICISVTIQSEVLDMIFEGSSSEDKFSVFSLLIPFVHREGVIGQQARDALLLIMSLSAKDDKIGLFVANESNFCPVLATGLSGLYSSLPCKLDYPSDDWHHLSDEDLLHIPDLKLFLNSLEFCNAVIQASHPAVCSKLLEFIVEGFLRPVLGPALNQLDWTEISLFSDFDDTSVTTIEEVVAATAYLDLFIRKITEPSLLKIFVEFILLGKVDEVPIIDILVARISSQLTRLCVITLMLFYSLVDLNCEDVMFHLVFKHILSGKHIMLSQHRSVKEIDFYGTDAGKLLSMIPECCHLGRGDDPSVETTSETSFSSTDEGRPSSKIGRLNFKSKKSSNSFSPLSPLLKGHRYPKPETASHLVPTTFEETSYGEYLTWAHCIISACKESCKNWLFKYDSIHSPLVREKNLFPRDPALNSNIDGLKSEPEDSSSKNDDLVFDAVVDNTEEDDLTSFVSRLNEFEAPLSGQYTLPDLLQEIDQLYGQMSTNCLRKKPEVARKEVDVQEQTSVNFMNSNLLDELLIPSDRPSLGPFLEALFNRVERMVQSTLYVNLQLTSLVARLSCYPQPLLRSLILSHSLIYQPSVKSFLQVLNSVKKKLEEYLSNLPQREAYLCQAYQFLSYRMSPDVNLMSFEVFKNADGRRRSSGFHEIFRPNSKQRQQRLVISNSSAQYVHHLPGGDKEEESESIERKNAIYAAITFKEFLKELAAISQEHAIICLS